MTFTGIFGLPESDQPVDEQARPTDILYQCTDGVMRTAYERSKYEPSVKWTWLGFTIIEKGQLMTEDDVKNLAVRTIAQEFEHWNKAAPTDINPEFAAASMLRAFEKAGLQIIEKGQCGDIPGRQKQ